MSPARPVNCDGPVSLPLEMSEEVVTIRDTDDTRLERLAAQAAEDVRVIIEDLLPAALDAQWTRGRVPDREETGRRAKGGHSDPTADTALDPDRLYLRGVLVKSRPSLFEAAVKLRGVRRGLERALRYWEGADHEGEE